MSNIFILWHNYNISKNLNKVKVGHSEMDKYRQTLQVVTDRLFNYKLYTYIYAVNRRQKWNMIIKLFQTIK